MIMTKARSVDNFLITYQQRRDTLRAGSVVGTSYGAMMTILMFTRQEQSLSMQQLNQWWYKINLPRLQQRVHVRCQFLHTKIMFLREGSSKLLGYDCFNGYLD